MILVTGGAGYIGSHCVLKLIENDFDVVIFDNLSTGNYETVQTLNEIKPIIFEKGDLKNYDEINYVLKKYKIDCVLHFAASALVEESVKNPQKYYRNNVCATLNLLDSMKENGVDKIVFSSTSATYGEPKEIPIKENHHQNPINPYGKSKLMIEKIMDDYDKAYSIKSVRFRYFNACGADSKRRIGELHNPETHLIPNILKAIFNESQIFKIFGTDYNTKDGTCVRDYIDVEDLANAHYLALNYLLNGGKSDFFNLGTTDGASVKEVFDTCSRIVGKPIPVERVGRRSGDPAILIADNKKAKDILNWTPQKTLAESITNAYNWEVLLNESN